MSSAGVAAQEIRVPLKTAFLHDGQAMGTMKTYWASPRGFQNNFLNINPITVGYSLNSPGQAHLTSLGMCSVNPGGWPWERWSGLSAVFQRDFFNEETGLNCFQQ